MLVEEAWCPSETVRAWKEDGRVVKAWEGTEESFLGFVGLKIVDGCVPEPNCDKTEDVRLVERAEDGAIDMLKLVGCRSKTTFSIMRNRKLVPKLSTSVTAMMTIP